MDGDNGPSADPVGKAPGAKGFGVADRLSGLSLMCVSQQMIACSHVSDLFNFGLFSVETFVLVERAFLLLSLCILATGSTLGSTNPCISLLVVTAKSSRGFVDKTATFA